jgi:hypothetical protein
MSNVIYRGPITRQPITETRQVAAAGMLPGTLVAVDPAGRFVAAGEGQRTLVLGNRDFGGQGLDEPYVADDTAIAFVADPNSQFQARFAAGSYTPEQPLVVAAGRLTGAGAGDVPFAFFGGVAGALAADALADVTIAA